MKQIKCKIQKKRDISLGFNNISDTSISKDDEDTNKKVLYINIILINI